MERNKTGKVYKDGSYMELIIGEHYSILCVCSLQGSADTVIRFTSVIITTGDSGGGGDTPTSSN